MKRTNPKKSYGHAPRKLVKKQVGTEYLDNAQTPYDYAWAARLSSLYNIFVGCLHNGFPVHIKNLWYDAWAFWPFFFVKDIRATSEDKVSEEIIPLLNHERIHCRQQWDIHITISFPLTIYIGALELLGNPHAAWWLLLIPFIPTIIYGLSMVRACIELAIRGRKITFNSIREETCFERESNMHQNNWMYLGQRKFWHVLAYTFVGVQISRFIDHLKKRKK